MARPDIEKIVNAFLLKIGNDPEARNLINELVHDARGETVKDAPFAKAVSKILHLQKDPLKPDEVAEFKRHLNERFHQMTPQNWSLLRAMPNYHSPIWPPPEPGQPGEPPDH